MLTKVSKFADLNLHEKIYLMIVRENCNYFNLGKVPGVDFVDDSLWEFY